tara:strand:- start:3925 stop:4071 length:147 start_codon:yes stop_codon:yes gene_type:complete
MFKIVGSYNGGSFEELNIAATEEAAKDMKSMYEETLKGNWVVVSYRLD